MKEKSLIDLLVTVIESNTKAMEKSAEAAGQMASEVRGLRGVITGAQRKIGGELGPALDRVKELQQKLHMEREEVRRAGSSTT